MSDPESILPEIVIDDTADDYVETDDEPSTPSPKSKPPATEIFEQENEPPVPAVEPSFDDVKPKKPKRKVSEKQRQHLASIRAKALESRKANAKAKREAKQQQQKPAPAPAPAPAQPVAAKFNDGDVDQLLDRYKARRRVKKEAKQKDEEVRRKVQHVTAPPPTHDDPWAECFL